jgi:hypothetical protein
MTEKTTTSTAASEAFERLMEGAEGYRPSDQATDVATIRAALAAGLTPDEAFVAHDHLAAHEGDRLFGSTEATAMNKLRVQAGPDPDDTDA